VSAWLADIDRLMLVCRSKAEISPTFNLLCSYTECKYGGPLGRPGTSSVEARLVSPQRGFSLFVLIVTYGCEGFDGGRYSRLFTSWKRTCEFKKRRTSVLVKMPRRFIERLENKGVISEKVRQNFVSFVPCKLCPC